MTSTPQHTPGPWVATVDPNSYTRHAIISQDMGAGRANKYPPAFVVKGAPAADVALIVAAPDLLAACCAMLAEFEYRMAASCAAAVAGRAAITKAGVAP